MSPMLLPPAAPSREGTLDPFAPLERIGLTPLIAARARRTAGGLAAGARLARVVAVHRQTIDVHDGADERSACMATSLARALAADEMPLAVGDWAFAVSDAHGGLRLEARVEPATRLVRRDGDGRRHAIVHNVDRAFVVMGLDSDFNPRRLERTLAFVAANGVEATVVLTKADMAAARPAQRDARRSALAGRLLPSTPIVAVDATDPATAAILAPWTGAGGTLVAIGSSGAGKSTLTNTLLGRAAQATHAGRSSDGRGLHTTTARTLFLLPGGASLIDTPGIRTLGIDADASALDAGFVDVAQLAARCRFRDCTHAAEPGCAVRDAVDGDRLANWRKLKREAGRDALTPRERRAQLAIWKSRQREGRDALRRKRG